MAPGWLYDTALLASALVAGREAARAKGPLLKHAVFFWLPAIAVYECLGGAHRWARVIGVTVLGLGGLVWRQRCSLGYDSDPGHIPGIDTDIRVGRWRI